MFLNTPLVKKLFKRAFNSTGLEVARPEEETIYIGGSQWRIEMNYDLMPFKQKAALIELLGDIPAAGSAVTADKEGVQYTYIGSIPSLRNGYMAAKTGVKKTPVVIVRPYADYQLLREQEQQSFMAVKREFLQLIDSREIDFVNEGMPCGPCTRIGTGELYWHSELGTLCVDMEAMDNGMRDVARVLQDLEMEEDK